MASARWLLKVMSWWYRILHLGDIFRFLKVNIHTSSITLLKSIYYWKINMAHEILPSIHIILKFWTIFFYLEHCVQSEVILTVQLKVDHANKCQSLGAYIVWFCTSAYSVTLQNIWRNHGIISINNFCAI